MAAARLHTGLVSTIDNTTGSRQLRPSGVPPGNPGHIFSAVRRHLHNFGAEACTVKFRSGCRLINLLSDDHSRPGADGRHAVVLEPYGYRWYRVGGLDYLLTRSEI